MEGVNLRSSRPATSEEDGVDQIAGFETPRSGVATPQPDLHDKRLPGIMSYFNQVRSSSFQRFLSGPFKASGQEATVPEPTTLVAGGCSPTVPTSEPPFSPVEPASCVVPVEESTPLLPDGIVGEASESSVATVEHLHPYPTPPASLRSSLRNYQGDHSSQKSRAGTPPASRPVSLRNFSVSDSGKGKMRRLSLLAPLSTTVDGSSVSACHLSNPAGRPATVPNSPSRPRFTSGVEGVSLGSASVLHLKKLTDISAKKSGTSTPTRALSASVPPPRSTSQEDTGRENGDKVDRTATHTPTPPGAQAPAAKGKLTIKIAEAKGLKMCRDPYVVVVFQRSELISGGPRPSEGGDDDAAIAAVAMGGIPIQRQGSDSGRPAMAIPMRSRQSSNTSISDYNTFRNRNVRRSFTNPKWDAEAILYASSFCILELNLLTILQRRC